MKINIHHVPEEGLRIEGDDPPEILDVEDHEWSFEEPVRHRFDATLLNDALLVTGRLWTTGKVRCSRCLNQFAYRLEMTDFVVHYPLTSDDIVDLTPEIRENIILAIPQKPLCREDCKGLCPVCGCDRNERSCNCSRPSPGMRWAGLDNLKL